MPKKFLKSIFMTSLMLTTISSAHALEIGVAWQGDSGMAKRVFAGFEEQIKEIAPDANLDIRPALGSADELVATINEFEKSKKVMVILRSNGAKTLAKHPPQIPAFIGGSNHPGQLGVIADLASPEGNITGVTYYIEYQTRLESFLAVIPDLESIHLVTEEGHPSGPVDSKGTMAACASLNLKCTSSAVKGRDAIVADIEKHNGVSLIVLGNQAPLYDKNMDAIRKAAGTAPVAAYAAGAVKLGALTALSADDHKLGAMLATKLMEVAGGGVSVQQVPVGFDEDPTLVVNMTTLSALGLELSPDLFEGAQLIE